MINLEPKVVRLSLKEVQKQMFDTLAIGDHEIVQVSIDHVSKKHISVLLYYLSCDEPAKITLIELDRNETRVEFTYAGYPKRIVGRMFDNTIAPHTIYTTHTPTSWPPELPIYEVFDDEGEKLYTMVYDIRTFFSRKEKFNRFAQAFLENAGEQVVRDEIQSVYHLYDHSDYFYKVLQLHESGYTYNAMGRKLNLSPRTIMNRVSAERPKLKEILGYDPIPYRRPDLKGKNGISDADNDRNIKNE